MAIKTLVLVYDFPPLPSVGAGRPYSLYKHFHQFGFYPIVMCRAWRNNITDMQQKSLPDAITEQEISITDKHTLIRVPHRLSIKDKFTAKFGYHQLSAVRKAITLVELFTRNFWPTFDEKYYLYKAAKKYLKENKCDLILVSGEPFILFKYAHLLSKEFNIPYVADYRDGWSTNYNPNVSLMQKLFAKQNPILKENFLSTASFFTTVTPPLRDELSTVNKKEGVIITNGVDLELLNNAPKVEAGKKFIIHFGGSLYTDVYVKTFFEGYERLLEKYGNENEMVVEFYGIRYFYNDAVKLVEFYADKYPQQVKIYERIPQAELMKHIAASALFLDFFYFSTTFGSGTKAITYAATKKPTLVIPAVKTKETVFFPNRDIRTIAIDGQEVAEVLEKYFLAYKAQGFSYTSITEEEIYQLSREYQCKLLCDEISNRLFTAK